MKPLIFLLSIAFLLSCVDTELVNSSDIEVLVYPNPVIETLNIQSQESANIRIIGTKGDLLLESSITGGINIQADISTETSGLMYVEFEANGKTFRETIIKQ